VNTNRDAFNGTDLPVPLLPIYQHPRDLRLLVWQGAAPETLSVLRETTQHYGNWRITFRIIGESHWISAQHADSAPLHEVLACVALPLPSAAYQHAFGALRGQQARLAQGDYQVAVRFAVTGQPSCLPKGGLGLAFPSIFGQTPFTHIGWQVSGTADHLIWQTQHLYPQPEGLIVVSSLSRLHLAKQPIWATT
jgi:hypothetical protein